MANISGSLPRIDAPPDKGAGQKSLGIENPSQNESLPFGKKYHNHNIMNHMYRSSLESTDFD